MTILSQTEPAARVATYCDGGGSPHLADRTFGVREGAGNTPLCIPCLTARFPTGFLIHRCGHVLPWSRPTRTDREWAAGTRCGDCAMEGLAAEAARWNDVPLRLHFALAGMDQKPAPPASAAVLPSARPNNRTRLLQALRGRGEVTGPEAGQLIGIGGEYARKLLASLCGERLVVRTGQGRYRLAEGTVTP